MLACAVLFAAAPVAVAQDDDAEEMGRAIDALGRRGGREAVAELEAHIRRGLAPAMLARAVSALSQIGDRNAVRVLLDLASHRRAGVRVQVAEALGRSTDPRVRAALADLLDDPDPRVRSAAAVAIGNVGARGILETVLHAAARGVPEAALALGQHAGPADVPRILRRLDGSTLAPLAPALRSMLAREDLPVRSKQSIVAALGGLRDVESERILRELDAAIGGAHPLRASVDEALSRVTAAAEESAR
jgi:HEAT repeat protein